LRIGLGTWTGEHWWKSKRNCLNFDSEFVQKFYALWHILYFEFTQNFGRSYQYCFIFFYFYRICWV